MCDYLRMMDYDSMNKFQRLVVDAKLAIGVWKVYRMDFFLTDQGKPINKNRLNFLK